MVAQLPDEKSYYTQNQMTKIGINSLYRGQGLLLRLN